MSEQTKTPQRVCRALVLGSGGVTGIAWGTGVLAGLARAGVNLGNADLTVGTSAGAVVGSQLLAGVPLEALLGRQLEPSLEPTAGTDVGRMRRTLLAAMQQADADPLQVRRRIGALALAAATLPEAEWLDVTTARLMHREWPQAQLRIVTVDVGSGAEQVFGRESGVPLPHAVAASGALPMVWPPVTIGERRYMSGAVRSFTNADLAVGAGRVLVLSLMTLEAAQTLPREVAQLRESGADVQVVGPDDAALEAIGPNFLDPARRMVTALAGLDQGQRLAAQIGAFWEGDGTC